jgi:hypothetical protein
LPPVVAADYEKIRSGVYSFTVYYTLADNLWFLLLELSSPLVNIRQAHSKIIKLV